MTLNGTAPKTVFALWARDSIQQSPAPGSVAGLRLPRSLAMLFLNVHRLLLREPRYTSDLPATIERFNKLRRGFHRTFWIANTLELFERFAFYGSKAVLAVYLAEKVALGPQLA